MMSERENVTTGRRIALFSQCGNQPLRFQKKVEGIRNTLDKNVRFPDRQNRNTFFPKNGNTEGCVFQNKTVIAPISYDYRRLGVDRTQEVPFSFPAILSWYLNQVYLGIRCLLGSSSLGISGQNGDP